MPRQKCLSQKDSAYQSISKLVRRFEEQFLSYKSKEYNETQTRQDFINPFFKALGWDVDNTNDSAEAYREVVHEDKIKIGSATKAPDYSFKLPGGKRLFFVEAKKPSTIVKQEKEPAYQIRRYAWSAKLPISILTDFEEFAVYECNTKPKETDNADVSRIKYITFRDYLNEFDFLWETFGKENILKGSFDSFIENTANKRGTSTVDQEFLYSLDEWRKQLALNIALRNQNLDEDELNFTVQQTLDRIIFLRIAEDRGLEPYGKLTECLIGDNFYRKLYQYFSDSDNKYNSGLFDFRKDAISKKLNLDNKVIKSIVTQLYYPLSPYEFSVISVEILGNAYEQFLGKQIKLTNGHRASIEEKLEVRKAGGVYYTPQYIVDYIVSNTVGKLLEGKTPREVESIKIVDPACGSGSFLLGAYQFLLDWHTNYFLKAKNSKGISKIFTPDGRLATDIKKKILLNNIYGVDIDSQAVEVTKLSLLLKCMEGETLASIDRQLKIFNNRILPTLDNNIKNGNSLVDLSYYDGQIDFGYDKHVKAFDWKKSFPDVFNKRKFDCVIGNPPWVDLKGHPTDLIKYYFKFYSTAENRVNLYSIFLERSLQILNKNGTLGFVLPNSLLYQSSYERIRKLILDDWYVSNIVRLPDNVFHKVKAESIIVAISGAEQLANCLFYPKESTIYAIRSETASETKAVDSKEWLNNDFCTFDIFNNSEDAHLLKKIESGKTPLESLCDFTLGITPYDKYKGHTPKQIKGRVFHSTTKKNDTFKPLLEGGDVKRYIVEWGKGEFISYGNWLGAPRQKKFFSNPRILVRQIISGNPPRIYAGYTEEELYNTQSIFNLISKENTNVNLKYLLALLNSKLINFYHGHKYLDLSKRLFQKILIQNCRTLPIKTIDRKNREEVKMESEIINFTNKLLNLYKEINKQSLTSKVEQIQSKIDYCEEIIDGIVYQLYNLTTKEIDVIEGGKGKKIGNSVLPALSLGKKERSRKMVFSK